MIGMERESQFIGQSSAFLDAVERASRAAPLNRPVLVIGERGTGKELIAERLHRLSSRWDGPLITMNCAALPETLIEAELFGHEAGAFTGATKTTPGKIETAQDGTLFLDEIGDMPIGLQAKMLRFLQERVIERVGGRTEIPVNIRVICATHRDIPAMVAEQTFREDLFYRVGEISILIPPLRERDNDVVLLAKTFLVQYNNEFKTKLKGFSDSALKAMKQHQWPGNIRELQNKLKSAVIMAEGSHVQADDLNLEVRDDDPSIDTLNLREVREQAESRAIRNAFLVAEHNMSKTAELLGVTRPTLYSLIEKYHLDDVKTGS